MMAFGAIIMAHALPAQVNYQYTGNPFTFVSPPFTTSDRVTATLHLHAPLAPSTTHTNLQTAPGFRLLLQACPLSLDSSTIPNPLPQFPSVIATIVTDSRGAIHAWDLGLSPFVYPGISTTFITHPKVNGPSPNDLAFGIFSNRTAGGNNVGSPGTWVLLDPAVLTANLIATVTAMHIQGLGSSLTDQLYQVLTGITNKNGRACLDLNAFANYVQAQTGNNITTHQAAIILAQVAKISLAIPCP